MKVIPSQDLGIWVGFNDLDPFISNTRTVIALASAKWKAPPAKGDKASLCLFDTATQTGQVIEETKTFNYPQGSRQTVIREGLYKDNIITNDCENDGTPIIKILSTSGGLIKLIRGLNYYTIANSGEKAYSIDFGRLHQIGGYGYINCKPYTTHWGSAKLIEYDFLTNQKKELVNTRELHEYIEINISSRLPKTDHYITHLLLSPDNKKIAFLYRLWLPDGGILTCLISYRFSDRKLDILSCGGLSHFCWIDNESILIYRQWNIKENGKRIKLNNIPFAKYILQKARLVYNFRHRFRKRNNRADINLPVISRSRFIICSALREQNFESDFMKLDGHPSFSPHGNTSYLLGDTYPNKQAVRELFILDTSNNRKMLSEFYPEYRDTSLDKETIRQQLNSLKLPNYAHFPLEQYVWTRSGLHCDLHPFWRTDGQLFGFHSSHQGYRSVYSSEIVSNEN